MTRANRHWRFWAWGFVIFIAIVWLLRSMLAPFVAGMAIAYLLDPVTDRLEEQGMPRWAATTVVLSGFTLVLVLAFLLLLPLLQNQVVQLVQMAPEWIAWAKREVMPMIQRFMQRLSPADMEKLRDAAGGYAGTAVSWTADMLRNLVSRGIAIVDVLTMLFIMPIVAFYLLRDWDRLIATINDWLPRHYAATIREQARAVDATLAGFVRGQATVCLVLGAFYAVALTIAGLSFGLVIGMVSGILSFIPFVGSLVGFAASVGIALFQFDEFWRVLLVAGIFIFGQAVEGNILTPKLVGDKVGLHPVWVIFALMAGGALFGFVGVLLAVPVAAVIGVLARFALKQYMESSLYRGYGGGPVPKPLDLPPDPLLSHPAAEGAEQRQNVADLHPPP
ncbi:AI-2E family transporter [Niveispirillum fermenti]|uniref:AI-2E family transporter n=1 Tax=Niveispirillum fermenti TaxID=1233113 RepID=UPI003A891755